MSTLSFRQILGWGLLIISTVAWIVLPAIPFLPLTGKEKAAWAGGLFVFAEITWWMAVPLLGKEIMTLIRNWIEKCKAIVRSEKETEEENNTGLNVNMPANNENSTDLEKKIP